MRDLLTWYLLVEVLGLACLPLAGLVLGRLPDRGWSLARPLSLVLLAFGAWLPPMVIRALPFTGGWVAFVVLALVAASCALVAARPEHGRAILDFVRQHWPYVICSEGIFAAAFWLMGWLRSLNPGIEGTEKFMDEAFLAAIIRAPHLPVADPWLSGSSLNYYYFGHFTLGILAKLLATPPSIAFNLGIALTAGLAASAFFGVGANLSALVLAARHPATDETHDLAQRAQGKIDFAIPLGAFAVLAALVLGNLRSVGLWWQQVGSLAGAWSWLQHPALWGANFDWWWPSRAIPNTITEFPAFSFLLADLHAHLLALPYTVLAIGIALSFWLAPHAPGLAMFGSVQRAVVTLLATGIAIGSLYAMNGWDLPTYLGLALLALALHQWLANGRVFSGALARNLAIVGGGLVLLCIVLYLPFYLTYNSPAQGVGIVAGLSSHTAAAFAPPGPSGSPPPADPNSRTYIGDEIAANGIMLFIAITWLLALSARRLGRLFAAQGTGSVRLRLTMGSGSAVTGEMTSAQPVSAASAWALGWAAAGGSFAALVAVTWATRVWAGWTLVWSLVLVGTAGWLALEPIVRPCARETASPLDPPFMLTQREGELNDGSRALTFPLGMIAVAAALIGVCEIVYLKDVFAGSLPRMNTVFKFYYQAWTLLALAAAPALAWLIVRLPQRLPKPFAAWQPAAWTVRALWGTVLVILVGLALVFPLGASYAIYPLSHPTTSTLDGLTSIQYDLSSGDIAAIEWINTHISGDPVIVEAAIPAEEYSSYYARVSTFTGLPTIMGWYGHEYQWRVNWLSDPANAADFSARLGAVQTIYTSKSAATVLALLHRYHARYLFVGTVEQGTYGTAASQTRYAQFLPIVYNADGVTIYAVPST
jgi:uncharacterized membrane protein